MKCMTCDSNQWVSQKKDEWRLTIYLRALHCNTQNFETTNKKFGSIRRKFFWDTTLGLAPCKPLRKQVRSWISPSYQTYHTVQIWHHATCTFIPKIKKTLVDICRTQIKSWKGLSGPGWRNKVWSSFVTALRNLSNIGRSLGTVVIMCSSKYKW